ncbi:MAG: DUF350 domain-containing protein [Gammaproteobacteria bacterium]
MTDSLDPIVLNFIYALLGGAMTLGFMWTGCKILNHLVNFRIGEELAKGNMAVGLMVMGIFVGVGIAMGLVIGLGLS